MENEMKVDMGSRIKNQRTCLELTREEFAEKANITPQFLSEIEHGKKAMSAETLFKICSSMDISSEYILFGAERNCLQKSPFSQYLEKLYGTEYMSILEDIMKTFCKTLD